MNLRTARRRWVGRRITILNVWLILSLAGGDVALLRGPPAIALARNAPLARVSINLDVRQGQIPANFAGLSLDFSAVRGYLGVTPAARNSVFRQLLANLGHGSLRLGGDTQDTSCWASVRTNNREACRFRFGSSLPTTVFAVAAAAGWSVIMGLNLALDSPRAAVTLVDQGILPAARHGTLAGLEIGNEPDFYTRIGARPPSYSFERYLTDFGRYVAAIKGNHRTLPLTGPAFFTAAWDRRLASFINRIGADRLAFVTLHYYPFSVCGAANRANATIPHLLAESAISNMDRQFSTAVRVARSRGLILRLDEINSVSCHGKAGVSNTFAAALWGLDTLFSLARLGVRGVNFHTYDPGSSPGYYNPIISRAVRSPRGAWSYRTAVRPLYYAMLLFGSAQDSRFVPVQVTGLRGNLKAYAVAGGGHLRVYLLNKDLRRSGTVVLALSRPLGTGSIVVLRAGSLSSTGGITLGGRAIDPNTGRLPPPHSRVISPDGPTDTYHVILPLASAVMVTFPYPRGT